MSKVIILSEIPCTWPETRYLPYTEPHKFIQIQASLFCHISTDQLSEEKLKKHKKMKNQKKTADIFHFNR
jgi:hypothetical protein